MCHAEIAEPQSGNSAFKNLIFEMLILAHGKILLEAFV